MLCLFSIQFNLLLVVLIIYLAIWKVKIYINTQKNGKNANGNTFKQGITKLLKTLPFSKIITNLGYTWFNRYPYYQLHKGLSVCHLWLSGS